jgi:hypothetical protein
MDLLLSGSAVTPDEHSQASEIGVIHRLIQEGILVHAREVHMLQHFSVIPIADTQNGVNIASRWWALWYAV